MAHGHNIIGFSVTLLGMFTRILEVGLGRTFDRLRLWMNGFSATAWPTFTWILKGFSASAWYFSWILNGFSASSWYFHLEFQRLQRNCLVFLPGFWVASAQLLIILSLDFEWLQRNCLAYRYLPGLWKVLVPLIKLPGFEMASAPLFGLLRVFKEISHTFITLCLSA